MWEPTEVHDSGSERLRPYYHPNSLARGRLAASAPLPPQKANGAEGDGTNGVDRAPELHTFSNAPLREFGLGAQVLADLGVHELRLISNAQAKIAGLHGFGLKVVERIPIYPQR